VALQAYMRIKAGVAVTGDATDNANSINWAVSRNVQ